MKLCINIYDNYLRKSSQLFYFNLFFLKNNIYFNLKNLQYIHIFLKFKNFFNIKIFKLNYNIFLNFILYFIVFNLFMQIIISFLIFI